MKKVKLNVKNPIIVFAFLKIRIDQPELYGKMNQLYSCFDSQLFHDFGSVGFNGADTDTQHIGDLPCGMAFRD